MHLVTGGSGFVGSRLVAMLHERGERVRVLDIWDAPDRPADVDFVQCDITDPQAVEEAMRGSRYVYHAVALVPLTKAGTRFRDVNLEGTRIALAAAVRCGVRAFVHVSSSAVYGAPDSCPITEDTVPAPIEAYGRAKLAGEQAVLEASEAGLPCAVIRPRTVLGTGRLGLFQFLFECISEGRPIYVVGKGDQLFQFIHVDDLARACILCAERERTGAYNLGTDRFGTLRDDLERLVAHAGTGSSVRSLPVGLTVAACRALDAMGLSPLAPWHYLTYHKPFYFDTAYARTELGWDAQYSNGRMLRESYDWFISAREDEASGAQASPHRSRMKEGILWLLKRLP